MADFVGSHSLFTEYLSPGLLLRLRGNSRASDSRLRDSGLFLQHSSSNSGTCGTFRSPSCATPTSRNEHEYDITEREDEEESYETSETRSRTLSSPTTTTSTPSPGHTPYLFDGLSSPSSYCSASSFSTASVDEDSESPSVSDEEDEEDVDEVGLQKPKTFVCKYQEPRPVPPLSRQKCPPLKKRKKETHLLPDDNDHYDKEEEEEDVPFVRTNIFSTIENTVEARKEKLKDIARKRRKIIRDVKKLQKEHPECQILLHIVSPSGRSFTVTHGDEMQSVAKKFKEDKKKKMKIKNAERQRAWYQRQKKHK